MDKIIELLARQEEISKQVLSLTVESNIIKSTLGDIELGVHKILLENNLYDYIVFEDIPIYKYFPVKFSLNSIPYCYAGEGDFQEINIEITSNKVKLFYTESWKFYNKYLFSFPLELLEDEGKLTEFIINKGCETLDKIKEKELLKKENRIATLEAQLNQLKNG